MQRKQQLILVGGIVAVGALAALPFARQPQVPPSPAQANAPRLLHEVPLHLPAQAAHSPAVGLHDHDAVAPPLAVAPGISGSRLEESGIPPELPEVYHPLVEAPPLPSARLPVARPASTVPAAPRSLVLEDPKLRIRPTEESAAPLERERTHRIVDGDTLERIAQRYWQDAALADALFAANRDVLAAPDPLPLGVELRIPARPVAPAAAAPSAPVSVEELPPPVRQPVTLVEDEADELTPIIRD